MLFTSPPFYFVHGMGCSTKSTFSQFSPSAANNKHAPAVQATNNCCLRNPFAQRKWHAVSHTHTHTICITINTDYCVVRSSQVKSLVTWCTLFHNPFLPAWRSTKPNKENETKFQNDSIFRLDIVRDCMLAPPRCLLLPLLIFFTEVSPPSHTHTHKQQMCVRNHKEANPHERESEKECKKVRG